MPAHQVVQFIAEDAVAGVGGKKRDSRLQQQLCRGKQEQKRPERRPRQGGLYRGGFRNRNDLLPFLHADAHASRVTVGRVCANKAQCGSTGSREAAAVSSPARKCA